MTATKKKKKNKPLSLSQPGKLELKKTVETGHVRQNFSHGRSKMVTVEVRKKRTYAPDAGGGMAEIKEEQLLGWGAAVANAANQEAIEAQRANQHALTNEEKAVRARALEDAKKTETFTPSLDAEDAALEPAEVEVVIQAEDKPETVIELSSQAEEAIKQAEEGDTERLEAEKPQKIKEQPKASAAAAAAAKLRAREGHDSEVDDKERNKRGHRKDGRGPGTAARRGEGRRREGKLTIAEALGEGLNERTRSLASVKRARQKQKQQLFQVQEGQTIVRDVVIPEALTVQELANRMAERGADVVKALMKMDVMATIDQILDADTAELVVGEFGHNIKRVSEADVEIGLKGLEDDETSLITRPPVVTVMGHVDHGKTSLLDALRDTDVASQEAGDITQHIGAYQVNLPSGDKITFIDTPGHEAFSGMRARGAAATDIVVLVIAADDGIMPQTIEAINHAKTAAVPIIVAINKIDRPDANAEKVRTELLQHEMVLEEMGGEILSVEVSAKERVNLDKLEETILLQAELLDLKANPDRLAEGMVIESKIGKGRGPLATLLVQRGTLRLGDIIVAGSEWGRIRALVDTHGKSLTDAGPALPVEIQGLNGTPEAGDDFTVVDNETRAREISAFRQRRRRDAKATVGARGTVEEMFAHIQGDTAKALPIVVKADAHGSLEAILATLGKLATDEVKVDVLHSGVGGINESDVTLAHASQSLIIGFNVRANRMARDTARRDKIEIRYYSVIYDLVDDAKKLLSGMLPPKITETLLGYAEILQVFSVSKVGKVAGCMVTEGKVRSGAKVRLIRDDIVIHEGELSQLKRFKNDAKEVKEGTECGLALANYQDVQAGDKIECFETKEVDREL
ncbi:MAG TPA: translation initiation factor IF-2 [Rhodospirillales bacterium]|jgi:translation initiation factor IF-2|nr:translation initiation factor IF-2 [Rhodospirillales bacterium]